MWRCYCKLISLYNTLHSMYKNIFLFSFCDVILNHVLLSYYWGLRHWKYTKVTKIWRKKVGGTAIWTIFITDHANLRDSREVLATPEYFSILVTLAYFWGVENSNPKIGTQTWTLRTASFNIGTYNTVPNLRGGKSE